jgi:hypothetical protein
MVQSSQASALTFAHHHFTLTFAGPNIPIQGERSEASNSYFDLF